MLRKHSGFNIGVGCVLPFQMDDGNESDVKSMSTLIRYRMITASCRRMNPIWWPTSITAKLRNF